MSLKGEIINFKNKLLILTIGLYINIFAFDGVCLVNGQYYENNKEYKKAYELLSKTVKIEPYNSLIHYNLGILPR
jgi:hypothetical protein